MFFLIIAILVALKTYRCEDCACNKEQQKQTEDSYVYYLFAADNRGLRSFHLLQRIWMNKSF